MRWYPLGLASRRAPRESTPTKRHAPRNGKEFAVSILLFQNSSSQCECGLYLKSCSVFLHIYFVFYLSVYFFYSFPIYNCCYEIWQDYLNFLMKNCWSLKSLLINGCNKI